MSELFKAEGLCIFMGDSYDLLGVANSNHHAEMITATLNELHNKNIELQNRVDELEDDNKWYSLGLGKPIPENPRFKVTDCPYEIQDTYTNRYYWLEDHDNVKSLCRLLNQCSLNEEGIHDNWMRDKELITKLNELIKLTEFQLENKERVLNDFMSLLNKIQANPSDETLLNQARDMLRIMNIELL